MRKSSIKRTESGKKRGRRRDRREIM